MRMLCEILSSGSEVKNITDRKTGAVKQQEIFNLSFVDLDFPENVFAAQLWENAGVLKDQAQKGAIFELVYTGIREPDQWNKYPRIQGLAPENIILKKSALDSMKEQMVRLQKKMEEKKKADFNGEKIEAAMSR